MTSQSYAWDVSPEVSSPGTNLQIYPIRRLEVVADLNPEDLFDVYPVPGIALDGEWRGRGEECSLGANYQTETCLAVLIVG